MEGGKGRKQKEREGEEEEGGEEKKVQEMDSVRGEERNEGVPSQI